MRIGPGESSSEAQRAAFAEREFRAPFEGRWYATLHAKPSCVVFSAPKGGLPFSEGDAILVHEDGHAPSCCFIARVTRITCSGDKGSAFYEAIE